MQNLTEIPSSEKLVDSRARINNNFVSVQSNFSGTTFPTVSIEVGQTCFRTDLAQKFELKSVNPDVWILTADLNKTYTNKEYVDTQDALKMPKAGGTFTGSVYGLTPIKGATTKELATMEALADGLSDKADSADLADVATSGSYTDLADKPDFTVYYTKTEVDTAIPDLATQAEAEAGEDNAKYLSALRVKQAIAKFASPVTCYPSWFYDRGDGSDGAFNPTGNVTISGIKKYTSINIPVGVTVTVAKFAILKCTGTVTIAGTITSVGQGCAGGSGRFSGETFNGATGSLGFRGGSGGSGGASTNKNGLGYGGAGGSALFLDGVNVSIPLTTELLNASAYLYEIHLGAGGGGGGFNDYYGNNTTSGAGGNGGGTIIIVASSITITGSVCSDGTNGGAPSGNYAGNQGAGGGGGGGAVLLLAGTISNSGAVSANGGASATGGGGASSSGTNGLVMLKELGV